jgi:hypothetical protein
VPERLKQIRTGSQTHTPADCEQYPYTLILGTNFEASKTSASRVKQALAAAEFSVKAPREFRPFSALDTRNGQN